MKVASKSENGKIECFYDAESDKDNFDLSIASGLIGGVKLPVSRFELESLIDTLKDFGEKMRIVTGGRRTS